MYPFYIHILIHPLYPSTPPASSFVRPVGHRYTTFAGLAGISAEATGLVAPDGVNIYTALIKNASSPRTEIPLQLCSTSKGNTYVCEREERGE